MVNMDEDYLKRHHAYYTEERQRQNQGRITTPGSQYLVHLLRGGYLGEDWREGQGRPALDIGCGSGFSCVTLAQLGYNAHGVEISEQIVEHARQATEPYGLPITFAVGENEALPHADASFDLVTSDNVIHYVQSEAAMRRAVAEYARVLKPGGLLVLTTNHPENWILRGAAPLGGGMHRLAAQGDYREGKAVYLFDSAQALDAAFDPFFTGIQVGENRTELFQRTLRHLVLTGFRRTGSGRVK